MDPLSVSASIIAVLQATGVILAICYDFRAIVTKSPWSLTRLIEETRALRDILERLESTASANPEGWSDNSSSTQNCLELLCEPKNGVLASCLAELRTLETKLDPFAKQPAGAKGKRKALFQALGWQLRSADAKTSIKRIERYKNTLCLALTVDQRSILTEIRRTTSELEVSAESTDTRVSEIVEHMRSNKIDDERREIFQWLSPLDVWEVHEAAVNTACKGTGRWLVESTEFSKWFESSSAVLWVTGSIGAGKTTLFASTAEYLSINLESLYPNSLLAYTYCDFRTSKLQDRVNIAGCLLTQIYSRLRICPDTVRDAYYEKTSSGQNRRPALEFLQNCLQTVARDSKLILLVDAVDESSEADKVAEFLASLGSVGRKISTLVMSRDNPEIERHLRGAFRIRLETRSEHVRKDVKVFIDQKLDGEKLNWLGSNLKADIARSLNEKADGMFQWVQCQLDGITKMHNTKAIRSAIEDLPESLYETYDNILLNVQKGDVESVQKVLQWLAFAVMPLTLIELREAIAIEPGDGSIDEESRLGSPQDIVTIIGSLVNVTEQGHIRLAHLSIKEYLTSPRMRENTTLSKFSLDPLIGHRFLAISCLTYLSFKDFLKGPEDILEAYLGRIQKYPFMKYAATAWPYHARATDSDEILDGIISDFFSSSSRGKFLSWVQVLNADYAFEFDEYPKHATSLYYAASFGLGKIVASLVSQGTDLDASGSRFGGTALHAAVLRQHISVMKILLEAGADQNKSDFTDVTPLHTAATYGNVEVVRVLLKFGAEVNARDCTGQTPLDWAEKARQPEVLRLLRGTQSDPEEEAIQAPSPSSPPPSPLTVWKPSAPYSPNIYFKRSSTDSSFVSTLEIGGTQTPHST